MLDRLVVPFQFLSFNLFDFQVSRRSVLLRNARKANESDDFSSILNAISQKGKETQKDPNDYSHLADIISDVTSQPGDRHPQLLETFQMLFSPKRKTFPKLANVQNFSLTSEPQLPLFPKDLANIFAPELPSTFECLVCRGIFPIVEGRILCSSILKSVEAGDSHPVCVNCIREYAHNSVFDGQVAINFFIKNVYTKPFFRLAAAESVSNVFILIVKMSCFFVSAF